jgi:hypothetical protein
MARHLNLLAAAARPAARPAGLPVASLPVAVLALAVTAGAAGWWSDRETARLKAQVTRLDALLARTAAPGAPRLDAAVLASLRQQTQERESLAAALAGESAAGPAAAPASQWLGALADAARPGMALGQIRIEPGPRLTLAGQAVQPDDVNGFITRLQQHPLAGTAPIGQLEMRRGETATDALSFRITPPPPASWVAAAGEARKP